MVSGFYCLYTIQAEVSPSRAEAGVTTSGLICRADRSWQELSVPRLPWQLATHSDFQVLLNIVLIIRQVLFLF